MKSLLHATAFSRNKVTNTYVYMFVPYLYRNSNEEKESNRKKCLLKMHMHVPQKMYLLVAVGSSGILKAKQKLAVTFNSDKHDIIDFTKFSKMTMCRASEAIS